MEALKRLGQNFLKNQMAAKKIVTALEIKPEDTVLEVGPGTGRLTKVILEYTKKIVAVEKDSRLIDDLKLLDKSPDFKIIEGDIRKDLPLLADNLGDYKLVGNIPYYLTGQLLRILEELNNPPTLAVLMVQKEVALRITGFDGSNQLASIISLWARPKILFHLRPEDFSPKPKVKSSVVKFEIIPKKERLKNEREIIDLIKLGFGSPRKTLVNNLAKKWEKKKIEDILEKMNLKKEVRPENLTVNNWIELKKMI